MISRDGEILRGLANELAEIAALPQQKEIKRLWKKLIEAYHDLKCASLGSG